MGIINKDKINIMANISLMVMDIIVVKDIIMDITTIIINLANILAGTINLKNLMLMLLLNLNRFAFFYLFFFKKLFLN